MYRYKINECLTEIDEEITPDDVDVSSFKLKDTLCPDFWEDDKFDTRARRTLLIIARDFIEDLEIDDNVKDVTITGSLANYNWDEDNSDIDLHIVMDFAEISDDKEILKKYFDAERKSWNKLHSDISIYGYPVEVYVQDIDEEHRSSGIYSLLKDKWIKKPSEAHLKDNDTNFDNIQSIVSDIMNLIDELEGELEYNDNPEEVYTKADELFNQIKEIRKSGMETRNPEMSDGNLVFKSLRRNGYTEKLLDIRTKAYDLFNSL